MVLRDECETRGRCYVTNFKGKIRYEYIEDEREVNFINSDK